MDIGDWQELSRLRLENHLWHRCLDDIASAARNHQLTADALAQSIEQSVQALNERLQHLGRRPVPYPAPAHTALGRRN